MVDLVRTGCVYEAITDNINLAGPAGGMILDQFLESDQSKRDYEGHILYS